MRPSRVRLWVAHKCRYGRAWGAYCWGQPAGLEALMGNKDKGGRHTKKQAARSLKQKRADKKAKQEALKGKRSTGLLAR